MILSVILQSDDHHGARLLTSSYATIPHSPQSIPVPSARYVATSHSVVDNCSKLQKETSYIETFIVGIQV